MVRSRFILVVTVLLVFAAGLVLGRVSSRLGMASPPPPPPGGKPHSWLADQLDLTTDQRQKMDAVWAETHQKMDESFEKRRALDHEREQALLGLLTEDQQSSYDAILAEHRAERADLDKQREAIIRSANDRSRALLSDSQRQRWDTLTKDHPWHGGRGPNGGPGGGPGGPGGRPGTRSSDGPGPEFGPPPEFSTPEPLSKDRGVDAPQTNHTRQTATVPG